MNVAVTGGVFIDNKGFEWCYRRQGVLAAVNEDLSQDDSDIEGFFKIEKICRYMPPWEAFCHPKCGFYQDFYQVRWGHPYSLMDYGQCECGCPDLVGATWEPDECLPSCLDRFRIQVKHTWHSEQLQQEMRRKRKLDSPPGSTAKRQSLRRDGEPLQKDLLRLSVGHDLVILASESLANIREGWPTRPEEYPPGFGVASPPGCCCGPGFENCDCMDDMRPQRKSETHKAWLEEPARTSAVQAAMDSFSQQSAFVRRHGNGRMLCYFETVEKYMYRSLQPQARAALDMASAIQQALKQICSNIPLQALASGSDAVFLPASAFAQESLDLMPLLVSATLEDGTALPAWLRVDAVSGQLSVAHAPSRFAEIRLKVKFQYAASVTSATDFICTISASVPHRGSATPWAKALPAVIDSFSPSKCAIHSQIRALIQERLLKVYDFRTRAPRDVSLKRCLDVLLRCLRMLRSASVANLTVKA